MKLIDLIGHRFGRLVVLERVENKIHPNGRQDVVYRCQCDCGKQKEVPSVNLRKGRTISCGCYANESRRKCHTKHGASGHRLYTTWTNIKQRCYNRNSDDYVNYGGRGIKVCNEWLNSFESFYHWSLQNGYREDLTIDRIDVDGNYEPSNCRWATRTEQRHNRRDTQADNLEGGADDGTG